MKLVYHEELLMAAAVGQLLIAVINLKLDKILHWEGELNRLSKLLREVFQVHKWFITLTLIIFGLITFRFSRDLATGAYPMANWFAAGVGAFWFLRTIFQWFFYSWEHWRGKGPETVVHWILTLVYGGFATVYLAAVFT
ncbi:MAG: hypothetical protein F7O42_11450 [Opitutae bacterium]|nr:hypothetical protein [Opitutae bacterium]